MNLSKIQVLVERIDKAISTINTLKDENSVHLSRIEDLEKTVSRLQGENNSLKSTIETQKKEIEKVDKLHEKLEQKIEEILDCLPEDENQTQNKKKAEIKNKIGKDINTDYDKIEIETEEIVISEESEEERIKNFVNTPKQESNLFDDNDDTVLEEDEEVKSQNIDTKSADEAADEDIDESEETSNVDLSDKDHLDVKFDRSLLDDEKDEITFYFNDDEEESDESRNSDLPKGIL